MAIGAISVLYLLAHGLSLPQVALLKAVQAAVILVADLPAGFLADKFGRRLSLQAGVVAACLWMSFTAYAPSTVWLFIGEVFNGISLALMNGAYEAKLAEAVEQESNTLSLRKAFGTTAQYSFVGMAIAALIGGTFVPPSSAIPWWAAASALLVLLLTSPWLLPPDFKRSVAPKNRSDLSTVAAIVRRSVPSGTLRVVTLSVIVGVYYQIIIQYWQPVVASAIGDVRTGAVFTIVFVALLLAQSIAGTLSKRVGTHDAMYWWVFSGLAGATIGIAIGIRFAIFVVCTIGTIALFFTFRLSQIWLSADLQGLVPPESRATYASAVSTMVRCLLLVVLPGVAWVLGFMGLLGVAVAGLSASASLLVANWYFMRRATQTMSG